MNSGENRISEIELDSYRLYLVFEDPSTCYVPKDDAPITRVDTTNAVFMVMVFGLLCSTAD